MPRSTTRRSVVAAALVAPLAATASSALAQEGTPAASDVEAIVRSFYEPFNTGDTSIYATILAEDWVGIPSAPGMEPGGAGFAAIIDAFRGTFPDLQLTPEDVIVSGDKAAVRSMIRGTQEGEFFGIPPTGQPVEFIAIDIHRIENGQIAESWHVEDYLSALFQLGVTFHPPMTEATPAA